VLICIVERKKNFPAKRERRETGEGKIYPSSAGGVKGGERGSKRPGLFRPTSGREGRGGHAGRAADAFISGKAKRRLLTLLR